MNSRHCEAALIKAEAIYGLRLLRRPNGLLAMTISEL